MSVDVVVIGAGMAGLACARRLADAGVSTVVLDKGRGIGGRMATRRVTLAQGEIRFDHGAQYFTVRDAGFQAMLDALPGATADWQTGAERPQRVGLPGMSGLPRAMAAGLDVRQETEVTGLTRNATGWTIAVGDMALEARHVVVTVPAPQIAPLLGPDDPLVTQIAGVAMAPCLTLMAAFPAGSPLPFVTRLSETEPLAWIAQDNSKPDRSDTAVAWVAQASPDWSAQHIEADKDAVAALMLPLLCQAIGTSEKDALYAAAHRWRYARVVVPLGQPFLRSADDTLHLGGDWCLGPRVEAAWQSGDAIARDILERRDVA